MRGKGQSPQFYFSQIGITPAYAGKRRGDNFIFAHMQDHPRLCGEKWARRFEKSCKKGSPPPMRGKDSVLVMRAANPGITPAYAGKS